MPRESYYQDVGNPIQRHLLPSRPLTMAFPTPAATHNEQVLAVFKVVGAVLAIDILDSASRLDTWAEGFAIVRAIAVFVVSLILICTWAASMIGRIASIGYLIIGFLSSLMASISMATGRDSRLTWIHAGIIAMGFVWMFALHWTEQCLASPIEIQTATRLRCRWRGMIALRLLFLLVVPVFAAVALPESMTPLSSTVSAGLVLTMIAVSVQGASGAAFVSWASYNHDDADAPGVLQSPVGGLCLRVVMMMASCFVIAACLRGVFSVPFALPSLVALALPGVFLGRPIREANTYRRDGVTPDRWQTNISNLRKSPNPIERKSYFIATVLSDNSPVLLPRDGLVHGHFLGDTGSGKTSLGLLPFIEQTIGFGDASVVVIDLKADKLELMSTMVRAAERLKSEKGIELPLKYMSTRNDYASYALNPMTQPFWQDLSSYQKTDLLTGAAGLQYGTEFGEAFYSSTNIAVINETFKRFPEVRTFRELAEKCNQVVTTQARGGLHAEVRKNGIHALEVLKRLGSFPPLNVSGDSGFPQEVLDEAIDLADVFRRPQMMYFHLNSTLSPGAAPALARFVTFFLLAAAGTVQRNAPVFLVIDEFQRMAASNFEYMLQLARSMNVHIILANQSMEDLKNSKTNLIPTIEANCGFRQWFSVTSSDDRSRLVESSGETVEYFTSTGTSYSSRGTSTSTTISERLMPRISRNDIAMMSDHMLHSIVSIARGSGYARYGGLPVICKSDFHITKDEYDRRQRMPWPNGQKGTFTPVEWMNRVDVPVSSSGPQITTEIVGDAGEDDPFADFLNDLKTKTSPGRKTSKSGKRRRRQ